MTIRVINSVQFEFQIKFETLVMLAGPRFALSEFSVFTYAKLENSDLENSDFSKTSQNNLHAEIQIEGTNLL